MPRLCSVFGVDVSGGGCVCTLCIATAVAIVCTCLSHRCTYVCVQRSLCTPFFTCIAGGASLARCWVHYAFINGLGSRGVILQSAGGALLQQIFKHVACARSHWCIGDGGPGSPECSAVWVWWWNCERISALIIERRPRAPTMRFKGVLLNDFILVVWSLNTNFSRRVGAQCV